MIFPFTYRYFPNRMNFCNKSRTPNKIPLIIFSQKHAHYEHFSSLSFLLFNSNYWNSYCLLVDFFFQDFYVSHPSSIILTQWKSLKSEWLSAFFPHLEWGNDRTHLSLALHVSPVAHWCSIWTSSQKVMGSTTVGSSKIGFCLPSRLCHWLKNTFFSCIHQE